MTYKKFNKGKYRKYYIDGICDFCKKSYNGEIIIDTKIENRDAILKRKKNVGVVFLWNNPGPTKRDIIDFLSKKNFIEIKYISKLLIRLKKDPIKFNFGFPKLMLSCNKCFRKKKKLK